MSDNEYTFAIESYAAIDKSNHLVLRSCSAAWRNKIAAYVLAEWSGARADFSDPNEFRKQLLLRAKRRIRANVGFPWLPLAFFIAEIIIKILIERWFKK